MWSYPIVSEGLIEVIDVATENLPNFTPTISQC